MARKQGKRSKQRPIFVRLLRAFLVCVLLFILAVGVVIGMFAYYGSDPDLPSLKNLSDYRPPQTSRVVDREGKLLGTIGGIHRTVVPFENVPKVMVQALIASEDAEYFEHEGIDYKGMVRAFIENVLRRKFAQGASTITQQVVKQLVLTPEKTLRRKFQEIILARRLTQRFSKEEILFLYLNHMYFGHGRYGVEASAQYYFGKSISDVNLSEAALLAGVLQAPERHSPYKHPDAAKARQMYVLGQMAKLDFISEEQAKWASAAPITVIPQSAGTPTIAPEVLDWVRKLLEEKFSAPTVATLGIDVKTTVDVHLQQLARQALERGLETLDQRQGYRGPVARLSEKQAEKKRAELRRVRSKPLTDADSVEALVERVVKDPTNPKKTGLLVFYGSGTGFVDLSLETRYAIGKPAIAERFRPGDVVRVRLASDRASKEKSETPLMLVLGPQAAMVVMDPNRKEILALVGGYGFRSGGFDRSQRAHRQPGSAFKPFVYAAAIDSQRYTAASIVNDSPEIYKLWKPQNHDRDSFRGPVRLRTALALSINSVAIKLLSDVGIPAVKEIAARAGIGSPIPDSVGLSLALGAAVVTPLEMANAYSAFAAGGLVSDVRLVTAYGNEVVPAPELQQAIRPETAYIVTSLMRSVVEEGTARAAFKLERPVVGKTGTANDEKDAWFIGYSPDLLAAVWVGFDDGHTLGRGEAGARSALPIWIDFMTKAFAGQPVKDFSQPPGIVVARIDPVTGLLSAPGSVGMDEVFINGTAPVESAPATGEGQTPDQLLLENTQDL